MCTRQILAPSLRSLGPGRDGSKKASVPPVSFVFNHLRSLGLLGRWDGYARAYTRARAWSYSPIVP
nr:MAG TPA: hypothetical protein [Caudoviricetes sp.]